LTILAAGNEEFSQFYGFATGIAKRQTSKPTLDASVGVLWSLKVYARKRTACNGGRFWDDNYPPDNPR